MNKHIRPETHLAHLVHSQCLVAGDLVTSESMRLAEVYSIFKFLVCPIRFLWFTAHWFCEPDGVFLFNHSSAFYHDHSFYYTVQETCEKLTVYLMSSTLRRDLKSLWSNTVFQDLDSSCISVHKLVSDKLLLLFNFPCIYSIASSLSINGATDGVYAFPCVSVKVSISCCQNAFLLSTIFILF